jgi:ribosomal protein S18 acetylase RimI-like enzyme
MGRPGDLGVVAEDDSAIGAAWIRLLPESDPGFGFVNASTPELSMGVVQKSRGQGVGAQLLEALISSARAHNLDGISLSVEPDDYARRLYERVGFREVSELSGSLTMLLRL